MMSQTMSFADSQAANQARQLYAAGDHQRLLPIIKRLASTYARVAELQMIAGLNARALDRLIDAERWFSRAAAAAPSDVQILNIHANSCAAIGKVDEALAVFDRVIALNPTFRDAWLNRAVTLLEASRFDAAFDAANDALRVSPNNPRMVGVRGAALKGMGDYDRAVADLALAAQAEPDRALARHNHAVALRAAGHFAEACEEYAAAVRLGLDNALVRSNWAAAALEAGQVDGARELYQSALVMDPDLAETNEALTRLLREFDGADDAFGHFATRARAGDRATDWSEWASIVSRYGQFERAADVASEGLARYPYDQSLQAIHAFAAGLSGDAAGQLPRLRALTEAQADSHALQLALAQLALRADDPAMAEKAALAASALLPDDQAAWTYLSTIWRMLDDPREDWLCGYDRYVHVIDLAIDGEGRDAAEAYARDMAVVLERQHTTRFAPGNQSLRQGTQTSGALFERRDPELRQFRDAVLASAERVQAAMPDDPTHPLLRRKGGRLGFAGSWSVRLSGGGFHVPHFHGDGWLSSAYYAQLPVVMDSVVDPLDASAWDDPAHQGWIQFGAPSDLVGITMAPRRIVQPKPGRLVLFPSYLWHGTLPFTGDDVRMTAAFDIVPR